MLFAQFCGGDPRPTDAVAWFDLQNVAHAEREWLSKLFSTLSGVMRERTQTDE
jgi:Mg2+ and Co2+ transporter CorA